MRLKKIVDEFSTLILVKDADFNQLGMSTSFYMKNGVLSYLNDEKYLVSVLNNTNITAVITTELIANQLKDSKLGIVISTNPKKDFYIIHNFLVDSRFYYPLLENQIDSSSIISKEAIIAANNVEIGKNCLIEPGVIIHEGVSIKDNVIIRSGTILGTSGFQFMNSESTILSVKTGGTLLIKDNVEIQHNCCVDKGVFGGATLINKDVKIDNFVHIAHDCQIGERTLITAGVKFGGRTVVGQDCWLGINAVISNGINIGDRVKVSLGSVVTTNVDDDQTVTGNFAIDHKKFIDFIKSIR